ncbi:hypothetical protein ACS0TY_027389 [Phlomoides rotata]
MWKFALISLLTIFLVWLWKVFCWVWLEPRRLERFLRKQGFKGNSYKFLFGDTKEIASMYKEAHSKPIGLHDDIIPRIMPFIAKTINKYGKNSFAWAGPRPRVYISDPELMREVLTKHTIFQKDFKVSNKVYRLLIGGLIEKEGAKWAEHRTKLNPAFNLERLKNLFPILQLSSGMIQNDFKKKMMNGTTVVDVYHYLERYTSSIVTEGLFHRPLDAEMKDIFQNLRAISLMASIDVKAYDVPGIRYVPTPTPTKALEAEGGVRSTFTKMANERIRKRREGIKDGHDLFDILLDELYDENKAKEVDVASIVNEAIGNCKLFFFAGYGTTSNLLVWTLVNLAIHQDWQARAREEVFRVLGDKKNINSDDLSQMKSVNMIVHEVFRLFSPIIELSRVVEEDTKLGNFIIPKGILLQLPLAILHRNPEIWGEDAAIFKPERFAEGILKATNGQAAFLPFGWGPRICIGQNLVLLKAKFFIADFLRTFTWELSPEYTHAPYTPFATQPQHGAPLVLREI